MKQVSALFGALHFALIIASMIWAFQGRFDAALYALVLGLVMLGWAIGMGRAGK